MLTYFDALFSKCEAQPVPPAVFIGLARQVALLGREISMADLSRCVCAGPEKPADFCSASYEAQGTFGELNVAGTVCDLRRPFQLQGTTSGGGSAWSFEPSSAGGGQYRFTGSVTRQGFKMNTYGDGEYRVVGNSQAQSIALQGNGCVTPAGCASSKETLKLQKREKPCPP